MELFDSHAHLMDEKFGNEVVEIIHLAEKNNVKYITNIGYDEETSNQAVSGVMKESLNGLIIVLCFR